MSKRAHVDDKPVTTKKEPVPPSEPVPAVWVVTLLRCDWHFDRDEGPEPPDITTRTTCFHSEGEARQFVDADWRGHLIEWLKDNKPRDLEKSKLARFFGEHGKVNEIQVILHTDLLYSLALKSDTFDPMCYDISCCVTFDSAAVALVAPGTPGFWTAAKREDPQTRYAWTGKSHSSSSDNDEEDDEEDSDD